MNIQILEFTGLAWAIYLPIKVIFNMKIIHIFHLNVLNSEYFWTIMISVLYV